MNRRNFFNRIMGGVFVFLPARSQARQEFTWPSKLVEGSIQKQTIELITLLKSGFIVNCRPGVFVLSNPIRIDVNHVDMRGAEGAEKTELHFKHKDKGGLLFRGASYVNISNIHLYWLPVDKKGRSHWGAGLMLIKSKNIRVVFSSVHGAPGAGFHFNQSQDIFVKNLFVENTLADGIHFQNSSNCEGYKLTTNNTGDDGVAIVDYQKLRRSSGFLLEKIVVIGSEARGIAFVGARDGVLKDFFIDKVASNGLHIEQDSYFKTRISENIKVFSGKIDGIGEHSVTRKNSFGVNILKSKNIELENVEINNTKRFGGFISHSNKIMFKNIFIKSAKSSSIFVLNSRDVFFSDIRIFGIVTPFINLVGAINLSANNITIFDQKKSFSGEVVALVMRKSKKMLLNNVKIKKLVLKSNELLSFKVFTIKASNVIDVEIDVISTNKVKVIGGGKGVLWSRKES